MLLLQVKCGLAYLARTASKIGGNWLSKVSLAGFSAGVIVMYGTALLVNF